MEIGITAYTARVPDILCPGQAKGPYRDSSQRAAPILSAAVFAAEKVSALGKDWHKMCLKVQWRDTIDARIVLETFVLYLPRGPRSRPPPLLDITLRRQCGKCNKVLANGGFLEHAGTPYCEKPCYSVSIFCPALLA